MVKIGLISPNIINPYYRYPQNILQKNYMEIKDTPFEGLKIIEYPHFVDGRGDFQKTFNYNDLSLIGIKTEIKEIFYSINKKGVIRGMHFQIPPHHLDEIVFVSQGSIIDVVVDIRKSQPTYGKVFSTNLNATNGKALYIPSGFAHGFCTLEGSTIVNYAQSKCYAPNHDCGIAYNSINFIWPFSNPLISNRDLSFPKLEDFNSPF